MAKDNGFIDLKKQIKEKKLKSIYLFFGEEIYIKELYINKIKELIDDGGFPEFNHILIEYKDTTFDAIDDAIESFPMMAEKKLIIIKNSGIFLKSNEETKEFWLNRINNIPETVILIFDETETDKRSSLYKAVMKAGFCVEFEYLSEADMVAWVEREALNNKKVISKNNAQHIVDLCGEGLAYVKNEMDKLINFCDKEITFSDIEKVVSKALSVRVFELTDAIMEGDGHKSIQIMNDLKTVKESAFKILYMICGTFDKMLRVKLMYDEGASHDMIADKTGLRPFLIKKYIGNSKNFKEDYLMDRIMRVADIDLSIKEGNIDEWTALEQYIIESVEYCCNNKPRASRRF